MAEGESFLSRWSRRKSAAKDPERTVEQPVECKEAAAPAPAGAAEPVPLPAVESLTPESDFTPFMAPEVDGDVRREALKTLFSDPRYNVMDMMDVYVDDYSKPDPIPESWMGKLEQLSRLGDRAGRDREEAERLKAQAKGPGETPTQGEVAALPGEPAVETGTAAAGEAGSPDRIANSEAQPAIPAIPAVSLGDSPA